MICNSSKRQKSATEAPDEKLENDSTLLELRPRILMQDLSADPFVEMDDIEENTDMRSLVSELSVEDIIEVDDEDNKEDGGEDNIGCIEMVDDSNSSNAGEESCEDNEDINIAKLIAVNAGMVASILQQVPNQPIKFYGDWWQENGEPKETISDS